MLYQLVLCGRLCHAKKYFTNLNDLKLYVKERIIKSDSYHKKRRDRLICDDDLDYGVRVLKINESICDVDRFFGPEMESDEPFVPIIPTTKKSKK